MDPEEKLALDYKTALDYFSLLTEIRFKLLAFVPTVSGIAVTIVAESASVEIRLLVGLFSMSELQSGLSNTLRMLQHAYSWAVYI